MYKVGSGEDVPLEKMTSKDREEGVSYATVWRKSFPCISNDKCIEASLCMSVTARVDSVSGF